MADKAVVTQTSLDAIGQAIIAKGGATGPMTPAQMPSAIQAIPTGEDRMPGYLDGSMTELVDSEITTLRDNALYYANSILKVELPNLTTCGSSACRYFTSLQIADFGSSGNVEFIGNYVFYGCTNLRWARLGRVTTIRPNMFTNCVALADIDLTACTTVPTLTASAQTSAFSGCTNIKVHVAAGMKSAFEQSGYYDAAIDAGQIVITEDAMPEMPEVTPPALMAALNQDD